MFLNTRPPYEVLSEEALATMERGWERLLSELGVRFDHPQALAHFRAAGQAVDDDGVVRLDPEFVRAQVALAPGEFTLRARNQARSVTLGGPHMVFGNVAGSPFIREGDVRRDATLEDYDRLVKLGQVFDDIDLPGALSCEPNDRPIDSRHLDMQHSLLTLSDKPHMGSMTSGPNAHDALAMAAMVFGSAEELEREPSSYVIVNVNSPLRYDERMLEVLLEYSVANQVCVLTPFLLMGAMSPVSIPASLVQQTAEFLAGVALTQLIRPGAPVVLGSFLSHTDMQSGAPGFGGPESALGLICSGQIARRLGLPWRSGGGALTSSQTVDAQAAFEGFNTMVAAFLAGANFVMHTAGWLESGLVASYEKYIVDIEMVRILREEFRPLEVDEESLAFDAHSEVGHAGHFLGAAHTLTRFRDCFYRPLVASTANYERWKRFGSKESAARAREIWPAMLERWEPPPMDDGVRAALDEYVVRRRAELGD
jgi:trimethylamine---corrinoid protein Co-methyltransferase